MIFSFLQAISQMSIRIASAPRSLTRCPGPDFLLLPSSRCPLLFRPVSCSVFTGRNIHKITGTANRGKRQPKTSSSTPSGSMHCVLRRTQQVVSHPLSIATENKDDPTEGSRKHARTTSARSPHGMCVLVFTNLFETFGGRSLLAERVAGNKFLPVHIALHSGRLVLALATRHFRGIWDHRNEMLTYRAVVSILLSADMQRAWCLFCSLFLAPQIQPYTG
ncbi:hypothetical protein C8F01DRAFT_792732 [Mycena amicta]|nr:hypothetical protein C8F01DRAFT_792732 [Mycena amicta]